MGLANIAATNMEHLCNCSAHGYSQAERWGNAANGSCFVACEGHTSQFYKGDRDCSSAVIDCWQEALIGTAYEGALSGATYTGNMRDVFVGSGLFEWHGMDFTAQRGDIYLNETHHTAMCLSAIPDMLGEFAISETGGIYGQSGDQTGRESYIHEYYDFPWNGILHYNGKADGTAPAPTPEPTPSEDVGLRGIDVSGHDNYNGSTFKAHTEACYRDSDFVIVKASQGMDFTYDDYRAVADRVLRDGKLLGFYHYAGHYGATGSGADEARRFWDHVKDYKGKAIFALDWERYQNNAWGNGAWAREFLATLKDLSGTVPWVYGGVDACSQINAPEYHLWFAGYRDTQGDSWDRAPWYDGWSTAGWNGYEIWQFTSAGGTDRNWAELSASQWREMAGGGSTPPKVIDRRKGTIYDYHGEGNQLLSIKHNDDDTVTLVDRKYGLALDVNGDPEEGTKVNFVKPNDTDWQKWKLVEMSKLTTPSSVSPFVLVSKLDENLVLDADSGKDGANGTRLQLWNNLTPKNKNQLWNIEDNLDGTWTIRSVKWPGKVIDAGEDADIPDPDIAPEPSPDGGAPEGIQYAVKTKQDGWLSFVTDLSDCAGIPGHAAIYLAVNLHGHGWYQVKTQRNGWLEPVSNCDINDLENGCAGDGSPILAVRVYYETQNPDSTGYWRAKYRTANVGAGYFDWQYDDETDGNQDGYAGDGENAIDRVQITLAR